MKKYLSILFVCLLLVITCLPFRTVEAATVKLNKAKITLNVGETYTLKVNGSKKTVTWSSNKKTVATVSSKGIVTAKKAGTATITAKVDKKTYTCKVTVVEGFDGNVALKKIDTEVHTLRDRLIAAVTNNYKYDFDLYAEMTFYNESGKEVDKVSSKLYYFDSGNTAILSFKIPSYKTTDLSEYHNYKLTFKVVPLTNYIKSTLSDISFDSDIDGEDVIVKVVNEGKNSPSTTSITVIYYKDDEIVGYKQQYADVKYPGAECELKYVPMDSNWDAIEYDNYDIYVDYSYYYTWQ